MIAGLALIVCGVLGAPAAADGGHLPGFSVAHQRVAVAKLPEELRFSFAGFPGAKGSGLPHVGHGPVWFGEVQRPKATIYVAGDRHWVCASEVRIDGVGGGSSCTTPATAREDGILEIGACGKGRPRHFRVVGLVPDGFISVGIEKDGGAGARKVPVIENTFAFTIGRANIVLRGSGTPAAEEFERKLPLARAAEQLGGNKQAGCTGLLFLEASSEG